VLGSLSLSGSVGSNTSASFLELGNAESVQFFPVDILTAPDCGFGNGDLEPFSFDDYIYTEFELSPTAYGGNATTYHSLHPSIVPPASFLPELQCPASSSPSLPHTRDSSQSGPNMSRLASSNSTPASTSKVVLSPSSSLKCTVCRKTFAFELRLVSHMKTHNTFACTIERCSRTFKDNRGRMKHEASFHKTKLYKICEVCGKDFYRKDKYDHHAKKCTTKWREGNWENETEILILWYHHLRKIWFGLCCFFARFAWVSSRIVDHFSRNGWTKKLDDLCSFLCHFPGVLC